MVMHPRFAAPVLVALALALPGPAVADELPAGVTQRCWHSDGTASSTRFRVNVAGTVVRVRNPDLDQPLYVCFYDAVCDKVLQSGRVGPRVSMEVIGCTDEARRADIYLVYRHGEAFRIAGLREGDTREFDLPVLTGE